MGFTRNKIDDYGNVQPEAYSHIGKITRDFTNGVMIIEMHEYASQEARRKGLRYIDTHVVIEGTDFAEAVDEVELAKPDKTLMKKAYAIVKEKLELAGEVLTDVLVDPVPEKPVEEPVEPIAPVPGPTKKEAVK